MSMNPTRSSRPWKGFGSPSCSTFPAHALQLTGFKDSEPNMSPKHAKNTEMRVSSLISSGKGAGLWNLVDNVENSCAEYALRQVSRLS